MTLQKALSIAQSNQYIARKKWRESGISMKLVTSAKTIDQLDVGLTPESLQADDWEIFEVIND